MNKYFIVGCGGFLGAVSRYWLGSLFKISSGGFPFGTFLINLIGSFVLGFFLTLIIEKIKVRDEWRLFFATGFVGAFTTFSSFSNEILTLLRQGYVITGMLYSFLSIVGGLLFVAAGVKTAGLIKSKSFAIHDKEIETKAIKQNELAGASKKMPFPQDERSELDSDLI